MTVSTESQSYVSLIKDLVKSKFFDGLEIEEFKKHQKRSLIEKLNENRQKLKFNILLEFHDVLPATLDRSSIFNNIIEKYEIDSLSYFKTNAIDVSAYIINPLPSLSSLNRLKNLDNISILDWPVLDYSQLGIGDAVILDLKQIDDQEFDLLDVIDEAHSYSQEVILKVHNLDDLEFAINSEVDLLYLELKSTPGASKKGTNLLDQIVERDVERELIVKVTVLDDFKKLLSYKDLKCYSISFDYHS
ncbi:MAG: hypothetical protein N3E37_02920 [Candidatus Micrarchaeota archaeon]|nr:hypothetical protein [Candidatus Micrarchaeota archaeon]